MNDLISRQAAIDALKAMAVPRYKDPACEDIWERDRTLDCAIDVMRGLPSAQSDLIRCKDCKHYMTTGAFGTPLRKEDYWCDAENFPDEGQKELPEWWFCAGAERKDAT